MSWRDGGRTLTGDWRAAPAGEELRRSFAETDFDDDGWELVPVPGHWRSVPCFADDDGPLLYRHRFEAPAPTVRDQRWWLQLDGLFYQGDVWFDGAYLGDTEGYFQPHVFEVTDAIAARSEHLVAVEVTCSPQRDRTAKRNITGVFQHWDCFDPDWNPGGIWRPVHVVATGPVRLACLVTRCVEATPESATLQFSAVLDAAAGLDAHVRTTVGEIDHGHDHRLASGDNVVEWSVTIERPRLWWPRALGPADRSEVSVQVSVRGDGGPTLSDERTFTTGLRHVRMRNWIWSVNGERLFVKGANQGPTAMALAEATAEDCERDVALAVDAGLDLLRLHAHVARPETYDAADAAGLLLWQDFPLQWGYARQIRKQAVRQARAMVELLGHHPSIAVWCAHNEPMALDIEPGAIAGSGQQAAQLGLRAAAAQQLPTWNKSILDRSIKRAIAKADGSRPVVAHSGILPHLPQLDGTDSHLYFGWYWGDERQFPALAKAWPRLVRFVTEFGAQAVPDSDEFMGAAAWPDLDWDHLARTHALQRALLDRYVPIADHPTYDGWKRASQAYQADVIRYHVETLRRLKYRPTGGFAQFCFADGHPGVTWSVLDHERRPKLGYDALRAACQPVIVVADRLPAVCAAGDALALDVHVVSDRRTDLTGAITADLSWTGGGHRWRFTGDVPADSCVRVGTLQFEVPDAPGPLTLRLSGRAGADLVDATYSSTIATSEDRTVNRSWPRSPRPRPAPGG